MARKWGDEDDRLEDWRKLPSNSPRFSMFLDAITFVESFSSTESEEVVEPARDLSVLYFWVSILRLIIFTITFLSLEESFALRFTTNEIEGIYIWFFNFVGDESYEINSCSAIYLLKLILELGYPSFNSSLRLASFAYRSCEEESDLSWVLSLRIYWLARSVLSRFALFLLFLSSKYDFLISL